MIFVPNYYPDLMQKWYTTVLCITVMWYHGMLAHAIVIRSGVCNEGSATRSDRELCVILSCNCLVIAYKEMEGTV